jgi:hypothetical protein
MPKDLAILVADADIRAAIEGLLTRPSAIPIRPLTYDLIVHPQRDPGVRLRSRGLLAPFRTTHSYALAILDHEGCGATNATPDDVQIEIENGCAVDWQNRLCAVAISPEVESWVWSDSPLVDLVLGWSGRQPDLRQWLTDARFAVARNDKPARPKEAFDAAIRIVRQPRSSTLFKKLGQSVGLNRCRDRAFARLRQSLQVWFPVV